VTWNVWLGIAATPDSTSHRLLIAMGAGRASFGFVW